MTTRLLSVTVQGKRKEWSFTFTGDTKYLDDWRADGLEVNELYNDIPWWLPWWAHKTWAWFQDAFNFFGKI